MKKLELKDLGVQEMNATEMSNVDGGLLGINLGPLLAGITGLLSDTVSYVGAQLTLVFRAIGNL
jgi:hypothetical protein